MNLNPILDESRATARSLDATPPGDSSPAASPQCSEPPGTSRAGRANGKIARLPKPVRDQINQWLLDGVSYPDIIERLGEAGKVLKPDNLSQWKKRGHQDWLLEQKWLTQTRARQEPASDLSVDFDATQINHAALQLATLHIFEALRDLGPNPPPPNPNPSSSPSPASARQQQSSTTTQAEADAQPSTTTGEEVQEDARSRRPRSQLDLRLGGDSGAFVRLINALARASRETMLVQKYRDACAQARAALQPMMDPKRKLTDEERFALVGHVNEILGLDQYEHDFEHQTPAMGIIRLDKVPARPEGAAGDGNAKSEGDSTAECAENAETI